MKKPQQPLTDKLELDRQQAITAKRALQSALERVNRVHAQLLPGHLQADLDHAARELSVGITALRDADGDSNCGVRKIERNDQSNQLAMPKKKGARE